MWLRPRGDVALVVVQRKLPMHDMRILAENRTFVSVPGTSLPTMDAETYLARLREELDAFAGCLDGDLTESVAHCGDWTLRDLADHLGRGNLWAAAGVTEQRGDVDGTPAPTDPTAVAGWFRDTAEILLDAVSADPSAPAWTFAPPHTVGFWRRRRCQETLMHRWDAENALGHPMKFDTDLAIDGVAEVFEVFTPRQSKLGRAQAPEQAVRLTEAERGDTWTYGPGEPVADIRAEARHLLLGLWGRMPFDDPAFTWSGDRNAARAVLAGPLVP